MVPVLAFAGINVAVLQTMLVPVIADLPQHLDTTPGNAAWVFNSTLLSGAVPRRSWAASATSTASGAC
jgi:hypothetical protein